MNLNLACNTTGTPALAQFVTCTAADGWNGINTRTTITANYGSYDQYWNGSENILDSSIGTNRPIVILLHL